MVKGWRLGSLVLWAFSGALRGLEVVFGAVVARVAAVAVVAVWGVAGVVFWEFGSIGHSAAAHSRRSALKKWRRVFGRRPDGRMTRAAVASSSAARL